MYEVPFSSLITIQKNNNDTHFYYFIGFIYVYVISGEPSFDDLPCDRAGESMYSSGLYL